VSGTLLGCIADDYTGATDLSSMLVRAGLRVVQVFGVAASIDSLKDRLSDELGNIDAVVIALKSRSVAAEDAVRQSLIALEQLQSIGADRFFFKYCSTFDSTPAGNIGPVAEALADALHSETVWFCPAFPENGRTVYCGHLFVDGVLLHESGMRNHPLNPMTDSNLVRVLQAQCTSRVGNLPLREVQPGSDAWKGNPGIRHWIVDTVADNDLRCLATTAGDHRLLTGGSAIARYWAETLFDRQTTAASFSLSQQYESQTPDQQLSAYPKTIILAGSCSIATRQQTAAFGRRGAVLQLNVAGATAKGSFEDAVQQTLRWCRSHADQPAALITSGWDDDAVAAAVQVHGEYAAARLTESLFAAIAAALVESGVNQLIVAGGETSGAVTAALKIDTVRIGNEIAPGVPWVHTLTSPPLSLALKSGNFGAADFFNDALATAPDAVKATGGVS
jgi:3-dehydrotetronate 4-kinase